VVLRRARQQAGLGLRKRGQEKTRTHKGKAGGQVACGLICADCGALLGHDVTCVHLPRHGDDRHASLDSSIHEGALNRRGSAVGRKQRRMYVQESKARNAQQGRSEYEAIGNKDADVRPSSTQPLDQARGVGIVRLDDGQAAVAGSETDG
jgi:hypothetical protein